MSVTVELTDDGNLRLTADVAEAYFPADSLVAVPQPAGPSGQELWLMPLTGPEGGGLLLKQRNLAGDRSTLIWEALPPDAPTGERQAIWDANAGALRVDISPAPPTPP